MEKTFRVKVNVELEYEDLRVWCEEAIMETSLNSDFNLENGDITLEKIASTVATFDAVYKVRAEDLEDAEQKIRRLLKYMDAVSVTIQTMEV